MSEEPTSFQSVIRFTAQSASIHALYRLYGQLEKEDVATVDLLPFAVFMAFSVEAYVNSVGYRHVAKWEEIERTPWREKIKTLHKNAGLKADFGKEPLKFAGEIFSIRDRLAHGKPEEVLGPEFSSPEEAVQCSVQLKPEWFSAITREWALRSRERHSKLMRHLGSLYSLEDWDHEHLARGGYLAK